MKPLPKTEISIENELVIVTTRTLHKLFQYKAGADAVSLYNFYYYTAKWQKTNQPKATDNYCQRGLSWGKDRFTRAKKILLKEKLIQRIMVRENGRIKGWYIKINYIWKKENAEKAQNILIKKDLEENKNTENQQEENQKNGNQESNASSANNRNASSDIKRNALIINYKTPASSGFEFEDKFFKKKIAEGEHNPRVKEIFELFNKHMKYGMAGEHFIYTDSGKRIDVDCVAANNLSKRYSMDCIKNAIIFYSEEMKKDREKRKYLPQINTLDDLMKKMYKLVLYADERGLDLYTGVKFGFGGPLTDWDRRNKGKVVKYND